MNTSKRILDLSAWAAIFLIIGLAASVSAEETIATPTPTPTLMPTAISTPDPTNGFTNPGFEDGMTGWNVWGPITGLTGNVSTAEIHGGSRSLQFNVPDTSYVKVQYNYKGAMYVRANVLNVSGWVKTVGGAPAIYILAYQTDDAGANKGYGVVGTLGDPSTSWVKVSAQVQPAVDPLSVTSTATLQINYFVDCATGGATTAYWDDMRMDVAPAGTLANGGFEAGIAQSDAGNGMPFA